MNFIAFTSREIEILNYIARGYSNKEISELLDLSLRTVQNHLYNMHQKSGTHSSVELLIYGIRYRYIMIKYYPSSFNSLVENSDEKLQLNSLLHKIKKIISSSIKANEQIISMLKEIGV